MTIHKEGYVSIVLVVVFAFIIYYLGANYLQGYPWLQILINVIAIFLVIVILQFFRHPRRKTTGDENHVIAPADGKVVVIEETEETEFLKDRRIQISIFMSPINVHVNRYPVSGKVVYSHYHKGLYLVAWHPKSSLENERTTVVVETKGKTPVLVRQIAGALARRIVCYSKVGEEVTQGTEMGFIKFGSRVDVFLPLTAKVKVGLNSVVVGGETVLAEFEEVKRESEV